ncbi:MAG: hypothetical protein KBA75_07955, partial [Alphaproteobacteria bacterium]|nr:hypothetical protein [Alphaproteobacteria bacterium]
VMPKPMHNTSKKLQRLFLSVQQRKRANEAFYSDNNPPIAASYELTVIVFVLWQGREKQDGDEDTKFILVYSTRG